MFTSQLSRFQRSIILLLLVLAANWVSATTTGYSILSGFVSAFFFVIFLMLLGLTFLRPLVQRLLWRMRTRLLVTYFLVGVLPVALLAIVSWIGFFMIFSQAA